MPNTVYLIGNNPKVGTYADGAAAATPAGTTKIPTIAIFIPTVFLILAIYFAYRKGFGFWGYAGFILLGGLVGGGISNAIILAKNKSTLLEGGTTVTV